MKSSKIPPPDNAYTRALLDLLPDDREKAEKIANFIVPGHSLLFGLRHGKSGIILREHVTYDGPSYELLKEMSFSNAKTFIKRHPIIRTFLLSEEQLNLLK